MAAEKVLPLLPRLVHDRVHLQEQDLATAEIGGPVEAIWLQQREGHLAPVQHVRPCTSVRERLRVGSFGRQPNRAQCSSRPMQLTAVELERLRRPFWRRTGRWHRSRGNSALDDLSVAQLQHEIDVVGPVQQPHRMQGLRRFHRIDCKLRRDSATHPHRRPLGGPTLRALARRSAAPLRLAAPRTPDQPRPDATHRRTSRTAAPANSA